MTDYASAQPWAAAIGADVASAKMPPFYADTQSCRHYVGENVLSEAEKSTIAAWVASGAPEGDASDYSAPELPEVIDPGPPDLSLIPSASYTPSSTIKDDYRCLPVGEPLTETKYATRIQVHTDNLLVLHHVIVFAVEPSAADTVTDLDLNGVGLGYPCDGGPGVPARNVGGWVPGGGLGDMPPDSAIGLPKGTRFVLQMHYNTTFNPPSPDRTGVDLWYAKKDPKWLFDIRAIAKHDLDIKAGDSASVQAIQLPYASKGDVQVVGVTAHMHTLGRRIEVRATSGGSDTCLLDIPSWDFHWQRSYLFEDYEPFTLSKADTVSLTCTYDNSAAYQSFVDGLQMEPRDVTWGEGTLDEMCLAYLLTIEPFKPLDVPATGVCEGFDSCFQTCTSGGESLSKCTLQCAGSAACRTCVVPALLECYAYAGCGDEVAAVSACSKSCTGNACILSKCSADLLALDGCAATKSPSCGEACGTTLP